MADTAWDRLEPHSRLDSLEEGLQARVADGLWMLARQWQVGELRGEDAASPIHVRLTLESARLDTFRNDAVDWSTGEEWPRMPLEARVECEPVAEGPARLQIAAEAGAQLLRRLDGAGLRSLRVPLRARFPLRVGPAVTDGLPDRLRRRLLLMARRALDGAAVLEATDADLRALGVAEADMSAFTTVLQAWRAEAVARFTEPGTGDDAWADERLEYQFSVAAHPGGGEVLLEADGYAGGHLDWYAFDVAADDVPAHAALRRASRRGAPSVPRSDKQLSLLPVPLAYAGMPASRWWEFEEGAVYFGGIEAGPADLGRLAVAEYASIYSDDWFVLPVRVAAGSLVRVVSLEVLDTFGGVHQVRSCAVNDQAQVSAGADRAWTFWELSGDRSAEAGETPWLLLPSTLVASLESDPVESVGFVRDEAANLAWAIEASIEGPTGTPLRRRLLWSLASGGAEAEPAGSAAGTSAWRYRLQTAVPPWWIPLAPERTAADSAQVRLRRARLLAWRGLDTRFVGAIGRVLAPERALRLYEEEVPKGGVEVTRAWQLARDEEGGVHLWMARRKRPGRGERASGLRFDALDR